MLASLQIAQAHAQSPDAEPGVPEIEVAERSIGAEDQAVVVAQVGFVNAGDVVEALGAEIVFFDGRSRRAARALMTSTRKRDPGEQGVQEAAARAARHDGPAVADGLLAGALQPVRRHPVADRFGVLELLFDAGERVEEATAIPHRA